MSLLRKALLESVVQSGSMTAARLSLVAATFVIGLHQPLIEVTQFDAFVIAATLIAVVLGLGIDSGLSLIASKDMVEQRHLMLWVALACPACMVLPLLLAACLAYIWIDPILLTWGQWGLAIILGYFQANLAIAYSFDRYSGSAIAISLKILLINAVGFSVGCLLLAQGGDSADFMIAYVVTTGLGNLWIVPSHLWRHHVPHNLRAKAPAALYKLVGFSIWYVASSVTLLLRKPVERIMILAVSIPEMLGGYIILSRLAELVGLLGTALSAGFMPIIIRRYHDADGVGKNLARKLLDGYFAFSMLLTSGAFILWPLYLEDVPLPPEYPAMPILLLLITVNIFIGGAALSGQGFVLTQKGYYVGASGAFLLACFSAFGALFVLLGFGVWAAPMGLLVAAAAYIILIVQGSERLAPVGYSIWRQIGWMTTLIGLSLAIGQGF